MSTVVLHGTGGVMALSFNQSEGEIWFRPCRYDGTLVNHRNPFTGEPIKVPRNAPLSAAEAKAVKALLQAAQAKSVKATRLAAAERRPMTLAWEIFDEDVKNGCMIKGRPSPDLFALLYALLVAGNWCLVTDDAIVVTSMAAVRGLPRPDPALPAEYPLPPTRVVLVSSAEDLAKQVAL